ncbi:MAG: serine hydrolase domain-containing protein [Rhodothermales bacterium]
MTTRRLFVLLPLLLLLPLPAAAQVAAPDAVGAYAGAIAHSREAVASLMQRETVPGISVAVMVAGDIVWAEGFGWADIEQRVPVTPLTKMRIGSVSKPITSAAVGLLMEAGRLDLDAPIQTYVPSFPDKGYPITTRQLAGHLAGIRHYRGNEMESAAYYPTVAAGLAIFRDDPLLTPPGERYSYSSYGWNLVSAAVEGAAGEPFLAFMQRAVFDALALRHTTAEHMDSLIAYRTRYYVHDDAGRVVNAPYVDNSYKWAGGGFISTAEDVVRFGDAILHGRLLRTSTVDALWASQRTNDGALTGYGIGWRTSVDDEGRRMVGHTGGSVGGTTLFTIYPDEDLIVCVISNLSDTRYGGLDQTLAAFFLEAMLRR